MRPLIAPSILSADFSRLAQQTQLAATGDWLHMDVMDGQFVPNLTIGPMVVGCLRKTTDMFLDVHLMVVEPRRFISAFADAGADQLTVHLEADCPAGIAAALDSMEARGVKKGLAVKPGTPLSAVRPLLPRLDLLLVMTVEPGFGGQTFLEGQLEAIAQARRLIDRYNPGCRLEVDGGINRSTIGRAFAAGADVFVAGSAVYKAPDVSGAISDLRGALHAQ